MVEDQYSKKQIEFKGGKLHQMITSSRHSSANLSSNGDPLREFSYAANYPLKPTHQYSQNVVHVRSTHESISAITVPVPGDGNTMICQMPGRRQFYFVNPEQNEVHRLLCELDSFKIHLSEVEGRLKAMNLLKMPEFIKNLKLIIEF